MKKNPDENKLCIHSCNTPPNNNNNNSNFSGFFRHAEKQPRKYQKANVIEIKKGVLSVKLRTMHRGISRSSLQDIYINITPMCIIYITPCVLLYLPQTKY